MKLELEFKTIKGSEGKRFEKCQFIQIEKQASLRVTEDRSTNINMRFFLVLVLVFFLYRRLNSGALNH